MDPNQETFPASGLGGSGNTNPTAFHNSRGTVTSMSVPTSPVE